MGVIDDLLGIIKASNNTINYFEAEIIYKAINKYSLQDALSYFYSHRNYKFLNDVVNGSKHLLSMWDRYWLGTSSRPVGLQDIRLKIDNQDLLEVFKILGELAFNDQNVNKL